MNSEIISVGTELLLGDIIDTNSSWIAKKLSEIGVDVFYISTVGDNKLRLKEMIKLAANRSDYIFFTGGLGPTEDDITKEVLCEFLDINLSLSQKEVSRLEHFFSARGVPMSENNLRQALIPEGAVILENKLGTANGLIINKDRKSYFLLPGPPVEMEHVLKTQVLPWIIKNATTENKRIFSHTLKFIGISESQLENKLKDLFVNQSNPTLALLAKNGEIHCRLTTKAGNQTEADIFLNPVKEKILSRIGDYYFGSNDLLLEELVAQCLKSKKIKLVTAESCTGGLISKRITDIPGSSQFFLGGIVAYDNLVKKDILNVPENILNSYGAVSKETAEAMAIGAQRLFNADLALATTGIAGPGGGTKEKPVGLVYIALYSSQHNLCEKYIFSGNRDTIRWRATNWALNLMRRSL